MKKLRVRHFAAIVCLFLAMQEDVYGQQALSPYIQAVYDACLTMRSAVVSGSEMTLRNASKVLRQQDLSAFGRLRRTDGDTISLNEHFVFNADFADSLVAGRQVYKFAQRYQDRGVRRGDSEGGKVFITNYAVHAKDTATFSYVAQGHRELAVVAEPEGTITLRIHDKTHDLWFKDDQNVRDGLPSRVHVFELPATGRSLLILEIINTSEKDISCAIISN